MQYYLHKHIHPHIQTHHHMYIYTFSHTHTLYIYIYTLTPSHTNTPSHVYIYTFSHTLSHVYIGMEVMTRDVEALVNKVEDNVTTTAIKVNEVDISMKNTNQVCVDQGRYRCVCVWM